MRFKGLRKKKTKFVDLHLEKDGVPLVFHLETSSNWKMFKSVKKLAWLNRDGWKVIFCTGNDPEKVEMFNRVAQGHVPSAKETMQFAGVKQLPNPVKKFWKKPEEKDSNAE